MLDFGDIHAISDKSSGSFFLLFLFSLSALFLPFRWRTGEVKKQKLNCMIGRM